MPIVLADLLDSPQVALRLGAVDKAGALHEIVQLLAGNGKLKDAVRFLKDLLAHEEARPTGVEAGVALTHLRTDLVAEIVIGIGRSKKGVAVHDGAIAKLGFVIGVPQRLANESLIVVGGPARLLREDDVRKTLLAAKSPDEFIKALKQSS